MDRKNHSIINPLTSPRAVLGGRVRAGRRTPGARGRSAAARARKAAGSGASGRSPSSPILCGDEDLCLLPVCGSGEAGRWHAVAFPAPRAERGEKRKVLSPVTGASAVRPAASGIAPGRRRTGSGGERKSPDAPVSPRKGLSAGTRTAQGQQSRGDGSLVG